MLTLNIGPLPIPLPFLLLLGALLTAGGVGYVVGRRQGLSISPILGDMLFVGIVVARIVFVALWFELYRSHPWSMLDIRDGGFELWAGATAALAVAVWRGWKQPTVRKPLTLGLAAGILVWALGMAGLQMMAAPKLPQQLFNTLHGTTTTLATLADGKPLVVNLWASWCPPCRREMPVLQAAQRHETGVSFVLANQGEPVEIVQQYLETQALQLDNVLLDPQGNLGQEYGSGALPTTLFFNAQGQLVASHLGELSSATLASKLKQITTATPHSFKHTSRITQ